MPLALMMDSIDAPPLSGRSTRKLLKTLSMTPSSRNTGDLLGTVQRHMETLSSKRSTDEVEDARRILKDVRTQYDQVHLEAEEREAELLRLREAIKVANMGPRGDGSLDSSKKEDPRAALERQIKDLGESIAKALESKKVYTHMCGRIQKEQALLKEKLLIMEGHLERKSAEARRKATAQERLSRQHATTVQELEELEQVLEYEDRIRKEAIRNMKDSMDAKDQARKERDRFEKWRQETAEHAAREAFGASAGRLRKMYAIEKLSGNLLQKVTFEQVERSQATEDGFQKIREVTGLTDVMDIVHKFLSRELEHEQLARSVKDAEATRENLREAFEGFKRDTSGVTGGEEAAEERDLFRKIEESETELSQVLMEHEQAFGKLQQSTLQVEHMRRWANRLGSSISTFEDCVQVEKADDLPHFFAQLSKGVDKFIAHIVQLISSGRVQRKNMAQAASKEYHEARRLLADKDFLKANCRVPASLDGPASRMASKGAKGSVGDNKLEELKDAEYHEQERNERKAASLEHQARATKGAGRGRLSDRRASEHRSSAEK